MKPLLAGWLSLLALGFVACGSSEEEKAQEAAVAYAKAVADRDAATMCSLSSEELLEINGGADECESTTTKLLLDSLVSQNQPEATDVRVDGDRAAVEITGSDGVVRIYDLVLEDGEWKFGTSQGLG